MFNLLTPFLCNSLYRRCIVCTFMLVSIDRGRRYENTGLDVREFDPFFCSM